ncbi:hypothetical protein ANO11243_027500 [Dothideomycetidae sp. 11243]|nr:hypothetical protein ANO11243_027500 [fungal sp. No.11243]
MATMMWFHTEQWGSIFIASWPRLQPLSKQVKAWKRANCPPDEQRSESPQDYDDGLSQTPMGFSPLRPSVRQEIERQRDQWLHPSAPPQHTATNMGVTVQTDYQVNYVSPNSEGNRSSDKIPTVVEGPGRTSRPSSSGYRGREVEDGLPANLGSGGGRRLDTKRGPSALADRGVPIDHLTGARYQNYSATRRASL